ncbi:MAG: DNA-processing protein DprA [Egibacteraceae bacterium]
MRNEQELLVAIAKRTRATMPRTVALLHEAGSVTAAMGGGGDVDEDTRREVVGDVTSEDLEWAQKLVAEAEEAGARLVTIFDDAYPANLRDVHDQPPFLFYSGDLRPGGDRRAIAVVGTRQATDGGLEQAHRLGHDLAKAGVTVVSGLAAGIDTAAHRGALEAGGRTIAVFGTGIRRVYPAENRDLAVEVSRSGACVSQFWPNSPPTRRSFPQRNVVTSGLSVGTVVVEASGKSGAAQQARHALKHGRRLFLVESLVREDWARELVGRPGVTVVHDVDEVLQVLDELSDPGRGPHESVQLTLA